MTIDEKPPTTSPKPPDGLEPSDNIQPSAEGGQGGPVPGETPATPEPPDPAAGDTAGAPGNTPVTTPETPTTPDTPSTGDASGDNNPASTKTSGDSKGLSVRWRLLIKGGLGLVSSGVNDYVTGTTNPGKIARNAAIGLGTGLIGGLGGVGPIADHWAATLGLDAFGGAINSVLSQATNQGQVNLLQVGASSGFSALIGGVGFLGTIGGGNALANIVKSAETRKEIAYYAVYGVADLFGGACNPSNLVAQQAAC